MIGRPRKYRGVPDFVTETCSASEIAPVYSGYQSC